LSEEVIQRWKCHSRIALSTGRRYVLRTQKRILVVALIALLLAGVTVVVLQPNLALMFRMLRANAFLNDGFQWTSFRWAEAQSGNVKLEKAAMLVPVTMAGHSGGTLLMQLDTGVYTSVLYESPVRRLSPGSYQVVREASEEQMQLIQFDGTIGDLPIKRALMAVMPDGGNELEGSDDDEILIGKIQRSVLTANPALLYTYTSPDYSNTENRKEWCW
jgi:hypothetical protein